MNIKKQEKGSILLIFLLTLPFLIMIALNYTQLSLTSYQVANLDQLRTEAQLAADSGADYAIQQFSIDNDWTGTGTDIELLDEPKLRTTFSAELSGDDTARVIAVTGKAYGPGDSVNPERTVKIYVDLRPVTSGSYSLVTGAGGLYMSNSSKVVGGDVYINGEISLSNTAQIGLSTNPVNVSVAHQICPNPADATYPRTCTSGENGQPISINNQAKIYGTVKANNQTNGSGMSLPGLTSGTVTPLPLPTYDRAAQKTAVATTITPASGSCNGSQSKIWEANTKITGNVTLSNSCNITIRGNVWITGTLSMSNTTRLIVDGSVGTTRPVIMVDGSSGASFSNSSQITENASGTGVEVITFYANSGCSPDCTTLTGTGLANSRAITTINLNNSSSAAHSIFYAYWTQVQVSNGGALGAIIGQTIRMSNTGTITFGASSGAEETTWVVKGYRRQ